MTGKPKGNDDRRGRSSPNPFDLTLDQQGNSLPQGDAVSFQLPLQIGRYRIKRVLGKGGFGLVYLAHDEQLARLVAIKVPHARLIVKAENAKAYLNEARTVANLDHPHIVPVFDVGSTDEFPCYVVSKHIEGTDLSTKLRQNRFDYRDAAQLVATVAEALHYAHKQGIVHRDVKPGNIMIDADGRPFVVDFGLALSEENIGRGPKYAGTPAYMSPEQARGEGHRVDGRSDIFSLGVVFYELLAGRHPFRADTQAELFDQVTRFEAKPLRQYDEKLPKELQRICHKAMAKRASERYSSAHDMAADLRYFLAGQTETESGTAAGQSTADVPIKQASASRAADSHASSSVSMNLGSTDSHPIKVVPKGLRSFDAHDADFFLELLPGPRDREGMPDQLRFWKTRIEETDSDETFAVGLIYGPSGCGKSSLVKAGLLPRLCDDVIPIYIEATPNETESRLVHGLRKRCPPLNSNLSLKETLTALRQGQGIPLGKKVLIVLDQFEQWLHAKKEFENTDLVQALRQCDGGNVQCIVMVRDDFWLAVSRFGMELEVDFLPGNNTALADLFDVEHARKVLAAFGRAFGRLPDRISDTSNDQKDFLKQSVAGLAEEGKVICVRLALFAEMMKSREWTPATLKAVGGTSGVGVTFLEEIFSGQTAVPRHRLHQKAARAVLKDLLPDSGTDIKGYMRSHAELLEASGYGARPKDFDDLIRILDSEIRLITPTDPEGKDDTDDSYLQTRSGQKYFQLTHDYLVHSLRDWLTRKQKETRRGRAELKLFDTAATWNAKPENRFLPSWLENLNIRSFTDKKKWTEPQRKMMLRAGRVHGIRSALVAGLLIAASLIGLSIRNSVIESNTITRAEALVESLLNAEIAQVPAIVSDLRTFRKWADPLLQTKVQESTDGSPERMHAALALLPVDESQLEYLSTQLSVCTLSQFPILREALLPYKDKITEALWLVAQNDQRDAAERFQSAAALAQYNPAANQRWQQVAPFVSQYLTNDLSPVYIERWRDLLRPAREQLTTALTAIHADRSCSGKQRETAAFFLSDYLQDQPDPLTEVILVADEFAEFSLLIAALKPHASAVERKLQQQMQTSLPVELDKNNIDLALENQLLRDAHWKRQSLAAVTLAQLGFEDNVWSLLEFSPNLSLRSFAIHYLGKLRTDHNTLASRLRIESDVWIRKALIQSLGGLDVSKIAVPDRNRIAEQLRGLYRSDPDPAIHSSASWTLRKWDVALPELPVGEPNLTKEQKIRLSDLAAEVQSIHQRVIAAEQELPTRQAAWERQLREKDVAFPDSLSDALAVHYSIDNAEDSTAEANNATNTIHMPLADLYAGPGQPEWIPGMVKDAIWLDGKGGHFDCGENFSPKRSESFSSGCWFLADSESERGVLFSKFSTEDERGFAVNVDPVAKDIICEWSHHFPDNALVVRSHLTEIAGHWHHLFVTYDGSSDAAGVKVYVDGQSVPLRTEVNELSQSIQVSGPFQIGKRDRGFAFHGAIDDVRIYDRQLSAGEVQRLFESGLRALVVVPTESRTPEQQAFLTAMCRRQDKPIQRLENQLAASKSALREDHFRGLRRWYVNSQGQTLMIMPPEPTKQGDNTVDRSLSISSHEVTVAEFRRFREQHTVDLVVAPTDNCPVHNVTWFEAAAYCNWLSEQEGIPEDQWVYEPNESGNYADGMRIRENAPELVGYRLLTETEWEYACRAGSKGLYGHGESVPLLECYARYTLNSYGCSHRVESLLPNAAGLFDMHGNLYEWTQNSWTGPMSPVRSTVGRALRGGVFGSRALNVRTTYRVNDRADSSGDAYGFRVARTSSSSGPGRGPSDE